MNSKLILRRACLKDLPDSLIFHLKRFDFNVRSMQRSKINDYFSFPQKIDMRPYKVEHLMGPPEKSPEDVFELVGILVHSGTAESGHYFSYIRERPSKSDKARWVEFNDDLVSPWDLDSMDAKCFGGPDMNTNFQVEKQYSAYMLFYERSSALASQKLQLERSGMLSPVRLSINPRLSNHIEMENEISMRKYCLYDPAHANFVTKIISNIKHINNGRCSERHELEKQALIVALGHIDQVVSRAKDTPDFITFMHPVRQICHSCAECSRDFLEWFCDHPDALRNLLLRNPEPLVRNEIHSSILSALLKVKSEIPYAYWTLEEDDAEEEENPQLIHRIVETINTLWDQFYISIRAWPEYFGLLGSIAKLGDYEAAILLDAGFLRKAVEIVSADASLGVSAQYARMLSIISKRMNTRPVSYDAVIVLLYRLLQVCDWKVQPVRNNERRLIYVADEKNKQPIPLNEIESKLLVQHWVRGHAHILTEKLLQLNQNQYATDNILVILLKSEAGLDINIFQAIIQGIRKNTPPVPCGPFLHAAVLYCHHSDMPDAVQRMTTYVSRVVSHLENTEGREFLQFFRDVLNLSPHRQNDPPILRICLDLVPKWAPALLSYWEGSIRDNTEKLLLDILLTHYREADVGTPEDDQEREDRIVVQELGFACLAHLHEVYISPRQQAVRAALDNVLRVIGHCEPFFDEDNKDDFLAKKQCKSSVPESLLLLLTQNVAVLSALKKLTVEEAEEDVSGMCSIDCTSLSWS